MFSSINLCTELCHHLNVMNKTSLFLDPILSLYWQRVVCMVSNNR